MNIRLQLKIPIAVGVIAALIAIAFLKLVPFSLRFLTTANCYPDAVNPSFVVCESVNNGWSILEFVVGLAGMYGIPLAVGVVFGLMTVKNKVSSSKLTIMYFLVAILTFLALMMLLELLWYRPWISQPYNRYALNAVYGSPFAVVFFFIGAVGFFIPAIIAPIFKIQKRNIASSG